MEFEEDTEVPATVLTRGGLVRGYSLEPTREKTTEVSQESETLAVEALVYPYSGNIAAAFPKPGSQSLVKTKTVKPPLTHCVKVD